MATLVLDLMGEELVLAAEQIDYGHDVTLNRLQLDKTVEQRVRNVVGWSRSTAQLRGIARGG